MIYKEFRAELKKGLPHGIFIFAGDEDYTKDITLRFMRDEISKSGFGDFNIHRLNDRNFSVQALRDAIEAAPVMSSEKLIEISEIDIFAPTLLDSEALLSVLENRFDENIIVIVCRSGEKNVKALEKTSVFKRLAKAGAVTVDFAKASRAELCTWVKRHFSQYGVSVSDDTVNALIDRSGSGMYTLSGEITKLAMYAQANGGTVTRENVASIAVQTEETGAFEFANAIASRNFRRAAELIAARKAEKASSQAVFSSTASSFSDMLKIDAALKSGLSYQDAAKACGMHEYKAKRIASSLHGCPPSFMPKALELFRVADRKMKSSRVDGYIIIDSLIAELTEAARNA